MPNIEIYTDGAASNNGYVDAYGGWAYAVYYDGILIKSRNEFELDTTNNICELKAIINACQDNNEYENVNIFSDSAYIINCYNQKWYKKWEENNWLNSKKEPVKNKDLWLMLIPFFEDERFTFNKVKGHASDARNNFVDSLAVEAKMRGKND